MNVPPNDSVAWIYVRMVVISGIILSFCGFAYKNHMSSTDIQMWLGVVGSVTGVDLLKRFNAHGSPAANPVTPPSNPE